MRCEIYILKNTGDMYKTTYCLYNKRKRENIKIPAVYIVKKNDKYKL